MITMIAFLAVGIAIPGIFRLADYLAKFKWIKKVCGIKE